MELTPEDRQRIEEEERKRLAEEKYRAQVRSRLENETRVPPPPEASPSYVLPEPNSGAKAAWVVGLVVVAIAVVILVASVASSKRSHSQVAATRSNNTSTAPQIRYVPVSQKIVTGQIVIKAGSYIQYRIRIQPDMRGARLTGSFNASGGSGNDITAVIAEEREFINWINGHEAMVFYGTRGKKTTDRFDVTLAPGEYYLGFSNKFSMFTDKYVFAEVDLTYSRPESY